MALRVTMSLCIPLPAPASWACRAHQPFIELLEHRIRARLYHRTHVELVAHFEPSAGDRRRPWRLPLSSGIGAIPISAPICLRLSVPSSSTFASTIALKCSPKPGTLRTISLCAATHLNGARSVDVLFQPLDLPFQIRDATAQFLAHCSCSAGQALLLRHQHLEQLLGRITSSCNASVSASAGDVPGAVPVPQTASAARCPCDRSWP